MPLIVHGLDVPPARIETGVGSIHLRRSVLDWAKATTAGAAGTPRLPLEKSGGTRAIAIVSEYFDTTSGAVADQSLLLRLLGRMREQCTEEDRVEGDMRAVIRHPHKLITYTRYPAELFDLESDPGELQDLAPNHPDLARELAALLKAESDSAVDASVSADPSSETLERLRALGYGPRDAAGK